LLHGPGGASLRAAGAGDVAAGASASLFVRPERVAIAAGAHSAEAGTGNRLQGTVRRVSFLGNVVRYMVEVAPGTALTVDVQNVGGARLAAGESAVVTWAVDDSRLLTN
jgi:ABC-type Fe3+/spermidine/putrescine transport system ATPase subunit